MLEVILAVVAVIAVCKAADGENLSVVLWGAITVAVCFLCIVLIPIPILRVPIGGAIAFAAMWAYKIRKGD